MTVIDRAHKIVLILVVTTLPPIFLIDLIVEIIRRDVVTSSGWQIYAILFVVAAYQIANKIWQADWAIVGSGLGTAMLGALSHYGTATLVDLNFAIAIVPIVGLVAIAISRRAPVVSGFALGTATVALTTLGGLADNLELDSLMTRSATVATLFGCGGWLLYQLRRGYEDQYAARDRFVATVSHELRTPLTALSGFSEALADNTIEPGSAEAHEILELLSGQAREAADIVEDLLVVFRSTEGGVGVEVSDTTLQEALDTVVAATKAGRLPGGKSIEVDAIPIEVRVDPLRLRQIIRNLLTNAVRHGGDDIRIRAFVRAKTAVVEVTDNGPGFDDDEIEKLFQPYGRSRRTKPGTGSIGLGLTVSRQLARQMGGELNARRSDGITVFELRLPLAPAALQTSGR
jgi:signal transduction histidine kinase